MKINSQSIDKKIGTNEELAKEYFLNMCSANALEEIEFILNKVTEIKWLRFFTTKDNKQQFEGNILTKQNLSPIRSTLNNTNQNIIETDFGIIHLMEDSFSIKPNKVIKEIKVFKEKKLVFESNNNDEIILHKGLYQLQIDLFEYTLDLSGQTSDTD